MLYTNPRRKSSHLTMAAGGADDDVLTLRSATSTLKVMPDQVHATTRGAAIEHARILRAAASRLRLMARRAEGAGADQLAALATLTERCADLSAAADSADQAMLPELLVRNARGAWAIDNDLRAAFDLVVRARRLGPLSDDVEQLARPLEIRFARLGWDSRAGEEVADAA